MSIRTILILLLIQTYVLIIPTSEAHSLEYSVEEIAASARDSTLKILVRFIDPNNPGNKCDKGVEASGFVVSKSGFSLSSAHILDVPKDCSGFTVIEAEGQIGSSKGMLHPLEVVSKTDPLTDLVLLKLPERTKPYSSTYICIQDEIRTGRKLVGIGFPLHGNDYSAQETTYQNSQSQISRWVVSSNFTHGFSGGPVYNMRGRVVAIIHGGLKNTPAVRYATPLSYALNLLSFANLNDVDDCELSDDIDDSARASLFIADTNRIRSTADLSFRAKICHVGSGRDGHADNDLRIRLGYEGIRGVNLHPVGSTFSGLKALTDGDCDGFVIYVRKGDIIRSIFRQKLENMERLSRKYNIDIVQLILHNWPSYSENLMPMRPSPKNSKLKPPLLLRGREIKCVIDEKELLLKMHVSTGQECLFDVFENDRRFCVLDDGRLVSLRNRPYIAGKCDL